MTTPADLQRILKRQRLRGYLPALASGIGMLVVGLILGAVIFGSSGKSASAGACPEAAAGKPAAAEEEPAGEAREAREPAATESTTTRTSRTSERRTRSSSTSSRSSGGHF